MASVISLSCLCRSVGKLVTPSLRNLANQPNFISNLNSASHLQLRQCALVHRRFSSAKPLPQKETVTIHFITRNGKKLTTKATVGDNLLDVVVENDIDLDGYGACEGTLACSTCHLVFSQDHYDKLEEKPTDEELDMLDLAYDLQDTSRLGCQVVVSKEMEGWKISVPAGVADARS